MTYLFESVERGVGELRVGVVELRQHLRQDVVERLVADGGVQAVEGARRGRAHVAQRVAQRRAHRRHLQAAHVAHFLSAVTTTTF